MLMDALDWSLVFDRFNERWPEAGDRLLTPSRDTLLAEDAPERSFRLLRGYKRAGDILVQQALTDRSDCNNLVFPALFNYRHYIELALKSIIDEYGAFANVSLTSKNHKLLDLWQLFIKVAIFFHNDPADLTIKTVGLCIEEISKVDASSTTFRYATNLKHEVPVLPSTLNLLRVHDVMNGICNFFECADLDFSHKTNCAAEAMNICG